ncbi:cation acetate symporter [Lysinibacillus sphaericus]|uniref:Cation acetate symporter n=3 Tax=Lysinibacillus TaxID=400634 RepID=A0A2S0K0Y3_LYSSH|nr:MULTISPECIES: cation acetate symporter [Lysinibacillus]AHN21816.1 symporter [Lysinibacillus varians]AVK97017.1 cation acetate symporter [Lysinibacillus sphaericus]MCS1384707.1 cation acetate symporter [Lysinibacillus sphaericus]MED4542295.1 cation acetate symporter [Lysinibacillus sphaericus]TKI20293.1 cation acetate symporter [Lysinibacillus sphaericus]
MNLVSVGFFLGIVGLTLIVTYIAAKRTSSASDFYTAGGGLKGWQNGFAIAGDYLSAAAFLGVSGAIALTGFDGFFFSVGYVVANLVLLYVIAEPMRNLGRYTLADMLTARFNEKRIRGVAATGTIIIVILYMIAQLVGAGALIKLLFGIEYWVAVLIVGVMMTTYVLFGGMTATSWVQIIKAGLLLFGTGLLATLVLMKFDFSLVKMFDTISTDHGDKFLVPGMKYSSSIDSVSMMMALVLGTSGLPHILMRFFTVKDAKTARASISWTTWITAIFFSLTIFLGFGAMHFVGLDKIIAESKAGNTAAPLLAEFLGGDVLMSFICAVAFATILAVVSGLVLTGASAISHDIYGEIIKNGKLTEKQQVLAARTGSISIAIVSIILALFAQSLNVSFLVSFAFCIGASANLPVILYTIYWKKFNSTGAVTAMVTGLVSCLVLGAMGPNVWSPVEGAAIFVGNPLVPLAVPAIITIPLGFIAGYLGSVLSSNKVSQAEADRIYKEIRVKANTGVSVSDISH